MSASDWFIAAAVVLGFLAVVVLLLWGEPFRRVIGSADVDRVSGLGTGAELTLAAFAAARLAHDPTLRTLGFVLLAVAALFMATGTAARMIAQVSLASLGAVAGLAAFAELGTAACGAGDRRVELLVAALAVLMALSTFILRMVLGGWWRRDLSVGAAALGIFALLEMAPAVVHVQGLPLLGGASPGWARVLLVCLLLLVALGVGLRPRFSGGVLAVALAALSLGFVTLPGPCGIKAGWLLTALVVLLAMRAVARVFR